MLFVTILVALPAAYAISRYRFTGDRHVFLLLIAFRITPPVVLDLAGFHSVCQGRTGELAGWHCAGALCFQYPHCDLDSGKFHFRRTEGTG